jgi:solute carrier family 25 aspartate/glutamate transporter 12/13
MATVTEKVQETLLGKETEPQLSEQNRQEFLKHAIIDEETGEYYMTEHEFIEAIAPTSEDYVHTSLWSLHLQSRTNPLFHHSIK